jgi:hypothetical protein
MDESSKDAFRERSGDTSPCQCARERARAIAIGWQLRCQRWSKRGLHRRTAVIEAVGVNLATGSFGAKVTMRQRRP